MRPQKDKIIFPGPEITAYMKHISNNFSMECKSINIGELEKFREWTREGKKKLKTWYKKWQRKHPYPKDAIELPVVEHPNEVLMNLLNSVDEADRPYIAHILETHLPASL